jgi:hypothetical protein
MLKRFILGAAMAAATATAANAAITVDGAYDADYGAAKSTVAYNPSAPNSNFQTPTNESDAIGYNIYLSSDANYVYGFLETFGPGTSIGSLSNLYFDIDPANGNGSDLGFEITNNRAFIPGIGGYSSALTGLLDFATTATTVEFRLANSLFTAGAPGIDYANANAIYDPYPAFPTLGDKVTLRLSQSFGYSVAGGASYGPDRLGSVILGGVPEPSTWAMMLLGFLGAGSAIRMRRRVLVRA